ncbi:S9 family peptidase [Bordetella sp. LUAb4]|uniref:S9 family peptidase n=1 Tax=Bordetella sp. LUAb4 TaxID=2843195 RepID=UPI001E445349|nr:S9 family peptidase [Bordetella sp. LUAb4]
MPQITHSSIPLQQLGAACGQPHPAGSVDGLLFQGVANAAHRAQLQGDTAVSAQPALLNAPAVVVTTAPPPQYPAKNFFSHPAQAFFRLSDDGRLFSCMRPVSVAGQPPRLNIFVQRLEGATPVGEARQITDETERDINAHEWKGSNTILYSKDCGGRENFHVLAVNVSTGKVLDLTPGETEEGKEQEHGKVKATVVNYLAGDPDHILVRHNGRDSSVFDIYRINVHTGAAAVVAKNPGNISTWRTDHAGKLRVALASDGLNTTVLYRDDENGDFRPIITTDYKTSVNPCLFDFDNKRIYAISNRGRDVKALVRIDPTKPDAEEVIFNPRTADVAVIDYSPHRQVLTSAGYETDTRRRKFFDSQSEALHGKLRGLLPGHEILLQSHTRDEGKFIVATYNDRTQGARYLYDVNTGELHPLAVINPALPESHMAPMQPIRFQARDGLVLHGYLTLPLGRATRNLPAIVMVHGGPRRRDSWGFNDEVQFFANRGYAVLQINFRGSIGYGRKFEEAGYREWGRAMQNDVIDGTRWLIEEGIADPKRIGVYGASYGGYVALAAAAFTPELYAAHVSYCGVSDVSTLLHSIPDHWKQELEKMYERIGHPVKDKAFLEAISPFLHAHRIKRPVFIAQGANDPRVPIGQSGQIVAALRANSVEVDYLVKENEGHTFRNQENAIEFYEHTMEFFARHLPAAEPPKPVAREEARHPDA